MLILITLENFEYSEDYDFKYYYIYCRIIFLPEYDYIRLYYEKDTLLHNNRKNKYYLNHEITN
jgi:hypothetical protein